MNRPTACWTIALDLGRALLSACTGLDDERSTLYADVVFSFINETARRALEAEMNFGKCELDSPFLRERMAEKQAEGRVEALAGAVLKVLEARRVPISDEQRETITACTDPELLDAWLQQAVTAASADELFGR